MGEYRAFLRLLLSLRGSLPVAMKHIETIVSEVKGLIMLFKPEDPVPGLLAITEVDEETAALEAEVAALVAGPNAAWDGSRIRGFFAFLQESGLLEALGPLLLKKLAGG